MRNRCSEVTSNRLMAIIGMALALPFSIASCKAEVPTDQAGAHQKQSEIAYRRLPTLHQGINVWRWFGRPNQDNDQHYRDYLTDGQLAYLRSLGFTAIRLPIGMPFLSGVQEASDNIRPDRYEMLVSAIRRINNSGLAVVIDFHPGQSFKFGLEADSGLQDGIVKFWRKFASLLSSQNPEKVFFELLNEPRFQSNPMTWSALYGRIVSAVREVAPDHTLIIDSAGYADAQELKFLPQDADGNLIYTVHVYNPHTFTGQGSDWLPGDLVNVPWPDRPADCAILESVTQKAESNQAGEGAIQSMLHSKQTGSQVAKKYCGESWTEDRLNSEITSIRSWSDINHRPVWVGEFGSLAGKAPQADRLHWLRTASAGFARTGLGAALWSYDDCWGLAVTAPCTLAGSNRQAVDPCETLAAAGVEAPCDDRHLLVGRFAK